MNCKRFGVMLDCSRNAVMKPEKVKQFVDYISAFGYNCLELYTEDTFEVNNEPFFGYMRGGYSKQDIKDIDAYCKSKGVELIPCIQTLAHLNGIFKWREYQKIKDVKDILLIGNERTYQLIENIFSTLSECFTSRTVNIGMDEAELVGLGKYLKNNGVRVRYEILNEHLSRVRDIAKKYGFTCVMWADMFFKLLEVDYDELPKTGENEKLKNFELLQGINITYWDYYHKEKAFYDKVIKAHKILDKDCWFAGACWTWNGFTPNNEWTILTTKPAMIACRENNIENILITTWGDTGAECSLFASLPLLFYAIKTYQGEKSIKKIKQEFYLLTGESYDKMFALGLPNIIGGEKRAFTPAQYVFYTDLFNCFLEPFIPESAVEDFTNASKKLKRYKKGSKFEYLFDMMQKLSEFLEIKCNLGKYIRSAYKSKDKAKLLEIVKDVKKAQVRLDKFYKAFEKRWYLENNPQGFDVQDIRIGGLMARMKSCEQRLKGYINGEIDIIPELEVELLKEENYGDALYSQASWANIVTVNVLKHNSF